MFDGETQKKGEENEAIIEGAAANTGSATDITKIADIEGNIQQQVENTAKIDRVLSAERQKELIVILKRRFETHNKNPKWAKIRGNIEWSKVQEKLEANPEKLWSLNEMEKTRGEPDIIGYDKKTGEYIFMDCSSPGPQRWLITFNRKAEENIRNNGNYRTYDEGYSIKPQGNAVDMAKAMGVEIARKKEYRKLLRIEHYTDRNGLCWVVPDEMTEDEMETTEIALLGGKIWGGGHNGEPVPRETTSYDYIISFRGVLRV